MPIFESCACVLFTGRFTNVVAHWPGSAHGSHVFRMSQLCDHLEQHHKGLEDGLVLGGSGYALRPFLLTPYLNPTNDHQRKFNMAHKRTRCIIERTFGQWKRRFHILHAEVINSTENNGKILESQYQDLSNLFTLSGNKVKWLLMCQ